LKHVETVDSSAPHIEAVPVRKNVHSQVMQQVQKVELNELKHVETQDTSSPKIEKVKIKKSAHPKVMNEIRGFTSLAEKKAEYEQKVVAHQEVRNNVIEKIGEKRELKHVDDKDVHDTSAPVVEAVPVRKNVHSQVFTDIQKIEQKELKHVDTVDKSQPSIESGVKVKKSERPQLFDEIKTHDPLALVSKKSAYERQVEASKVVDSSIHNREGQDTGELAGVQKKLKQQYESQVASSNVEKEGTKVEKDGDKVTYKNLPPKKDLNDLI